MNGKKLAAAAMIAAMAWTGAMASASAAVAQERDYRVLVDGKAVTFAQPPIERNGRVMVPLRGVFEALGADVRWESASKRVTIVSGERTIELTVNSAVAVIDGASRQLDTPPAIVGGSVLVPLRFVGEALGADVQWSAATGAIAIVSRGGNGAAAPGGTDTPVGGADKADGGEADEETFAPLDGDGMYPLSEREQELAELINAYRKELGLPAFKVSKSLTKVARYHVYDSNANHPSSKGACSLHSWSEGGDWTGGCYTSDNAKAELMWDKPKEITDGAYTGNGFEISYWNSGGATPSDALKGWKASASHNNLLVGDGYWDKLTVMGVSVHGEYAHVWFGEAEDPDGYFEL